ncbi:TPA: hypothetical protein RRU80_004427 [Klebsiella variicola]|nr:hypothetical protein [Klebsiella variicola]
MNFRIVTTFLMALPFGVAMANNYLGLELGTANKESVVNELKKEKASFEDDYGCKGYRELPKIKVSSFKIFDKYGRVESSVLSFSPDDKLYSIYVNWWDNGKSFTLIKDSLDVKYGHPKVNNQGFKTGYEYKDDDVKIYLIRDAFGFSDSQKTSIEYIFTPVLTSVTEMQGKIDQDIKLNNAKKASQDL